AHDSLQRSCVTRHDRRPVVGGDDRPLDEDRMGDECGDPAISVSWRTPVVAQADLSRDGFTDPRDVPGLQPEPFENGGDLRGGGWLFEVAALRVGHSGLVEGTD